MELATAIDALEVPAGDWIVSVPQETLPSDVSRIKALIENEQAPISTWIDVARAYLAQGQPQLCEALLNKLIDVSDSDLRYSNPVTAIEQKAQLRFAQVQAYCFLAQIKLDEAAASAKPDAMAINAATNLLSRAEELDRDEGMLVIMKGQISILQENYHAAKMTFQRAKSVPINKKRSVAAHVALAQLLFSQREFKAALNQYTEALTAGHHTAGSNHIRLGIGACHVKLGDMEAARVAFERVLALDHSSAEALVGLAAVEVITGNVERFTEFLLEAYRLDPQSSPLNATLAQFCLVRGELTAAEEYARVAVATATDKYVKAQALCILGRTMQAQGDTSHALQLYTESMEAHETALAVYGYAQMLIKQGQIVNANTELEKVLQARNSDLDALLLMGSLLPNASAGAPTQKRLDLLKEGALQHTENPAVQEVLGEALAVVEPGGSASAFRRALQLLRESAAGQKHGDLDPQLLNNASVLEYRSKRYDEALPLLREALQRMEAEQESSLKQESILLMRYNIARCQEARGAMQEARAEYESIRVADPKFVHCSLRLGYMMIRDGKRADAEALFRECAEVEHGKEDALAALCMSKSWIKDWSAAKDCAKKLLELASTDEAKSFAHVLAGNVYFHSAPAPDIRMALKDKYEKLENTRRDRLLAASREFKDALKYQSGNIYAANGLGAVCASLGQLDAARTIFSQLRESAALASGFVEVPDVWVNLGSLHLARGEAHDAARMYSAALSRFHGNKDPKVLVWLARAFYDAKDNKSCKRALLKVVHLFPYDQTQFFNLAVSMQQSASQVITRVTERKSGQPPVPRAQLESASVSVIQALGLFRKLMKLPAKVMQLKELKPDHLRMHITHCDSLSKKADMLIKLAREQDSIRQKQVEEQETRLQLLKDAEAVQKRIKDETEAVRARQQADKLAAQQEKWRARNQEWLQQKQMEQAAKKGDANKAAKVRRNQQQLEAEQEARHEADIAAAMMGGGSSSSDAEYDEQAMAADAAQAEKEERQLREAGYDSSDERGTADAVHGLPDDRRKKKKSKKRKKSHVEPQELGDELADMDVGLQDDPGPEEKRTKALDSDDE